MDTPLSRLYLDACCIIYLVEASNPFHAGVVKRIEAAQHEPASRLVTSRLSLLECRVRPAKDASAVLLSAYDAFFDADRVIVAEIDAEVVDRATQLRALHGFSSPDALHLATALVQSADTFLTGDAKLAKCKDIAVEVLRLR